MSDHTVYSGKQIFREGESFFINRCEEQIKQKSIYHSHDFLEMCYVCTGTGYHLVGEEEYKVAKGDLFIINYDVPHTFYKQDQNDSLITYNIVFTPGFLDESLMPFHDFNSLTLSYLFNSIWDDQLVREDLRLTAEEQKDFDILISHIFQEYMLRQNGHDAMIRAYMIALITKIMRGFNHRSLQDVSQNKKAIVIQEALNYLREHYFETFNLSELALKSFFSKNYFCRLFKEITGTTVSQFVCGIRIDEACNLLLTTDKTIAQVSADVGFSDYKAFHLAFKKLKGLPPGKYRKSAGM